MPYQAGTDAIIYNADTVETPQQVDEEIQFLFTVVG